MQVDNTQHVPKGRWHIGVQTVQTGSVNNKGGQRVPRHGKGGEGRRCRRTNRLSTVDSTAIFRGSRRDLSATSKSGYKDLGLYPPDRNMTPQFKSRRDRVDDWTVKIRAGKVPTRSVWLSYQSQLWEGMKYRLGTLPASLDDLKNGLDKRDHKILSKLGICRNITTPWRYLPHCYRGIELNSLPIEVITASLNSFSQHYKTELDLGIFLMVSIENLQIELGTARCPFEYNYNIWKDLAIDSWVQLIYKRIRKFDNIGPANF